MTTVESQKEVSNIADLDKSARTLAKDIVKKMKAIGKQNGVTIEYDLNSKNADNYHAEYFIWKKDGRIVLDAGFGYNRTLIQTGTQKIPWRVCFRKRKKHQYQYQLHIEKACKKFGYNVDDELSRRTKEFPYRLWIQVPQEVVDGTLTPEKIAERLYRFLENIVAEFPDNESRQPEVDKEKYSENAKLLTLNKNLVLTGAPGTGKTYLAREIIAKELTGTSYEEQDKLPEEERQIAFVQFHPSYDYTDFVEGLRPLKKDKDSEIGFERKDGVFKEFCKKALKNAKQNFVFIIDEINRGEISKIFGELFFSIDAGYRGKKGEVQTQYQNLIDKDGTDEFRKVFFVPENVYIIGTMNDIDRSVESMDFAIRRRFAWVEITAADSANAMRSLLTDESIATMKRLNKAISKIEGLNSSYHIGAAYFLKLKEKEYNGDYQKLWDYHLKVILSEYLRGMQGAEENMEKLKEAYDGIVPNGD